MKRSIRYLVLAGIAMAAGSSADALVSATALDQGHAPFFTTIASLYDSIVTSTWNTNQFQQADDGANQIGNDDARWCMRKTVLFDPKNRCMYLGATESGATTDALVKMTIASDGTITKTSLAPSTATCVVYDGAGGQAAAAASPLQTGIAQIWDMALLDDGRPVVIKRASISLPGGTEVYIVDDTDAGTRLIQVPVTFIYDGHATPVASRALNVAAGTWRKTTGDATEKVTTAVDAIFLAIPANDADPLNLTNGDTADIIKPLQVSSARVVTAIGSNTISTTAVATDACKALNCMHWDNYMQRLYCGYVVDTPAAGTDYALGMFAGTMTSAGAFAVENLMTSAADADANSGMTTVYNIKTMHLKNGSYLIFSGAAGSDTGLGFNTVSALPLHRRYYAADADDFAREIDPDTLANATGQTGRVVKAASEAIETAGAIAVAANTWEYTAAAGSEHYQARGRVGNSGVPVVEASDIRFPVTDLQVVGNCVFASVLAPRVDAGTAATLTEPAGVYMTRAIENADGKLVGWTDWKRVGGVTENVYALGVDETNGKIWRLPGARSLPLNVNDWYADASTSQNNLETLTAQLKTDFPEGIYKVKSQVVTTRATKYSRATQAHLLVAAGKNKVAVMAFGLTQAQQYTVGTDYYKLYTMTDMGEIYDIAISPHSIKGHIAVGGQGGVSLLRTAASGLGWDAIPTDLTVDSLNAATFKRIYTAEPVYRLHCDANTTAPLLHFAVDKSIYTIPLTAANLTDAAITTALPTATQAVVAGTPTTLTASERITDFAIVSDADTLSLFAGYFVGTTKRLFYQKLDGEAGDGVEIKSSGYGSSAMEGNSLGAISQISLVENARGTAAAADTQDMELNVLASDIDDDTCKFYRFAVETATAAATIVAARIKRLYQVTLATDSTLTDHWLDLGRARGNFYADGLFMLHTMPHHLGRTDCVNKISMQNRALRGMNAALYTALGTDYTTTPTRTAALVKATEASMDIHKATTDIYVSPIEHISATGSWMTTVISTTAGSVRVNE